MLTPQTQSSKTSAYNQYVYMSDSDSMLFGQVELFLSQIAYFVKMPNMKERGAKVSLSFGNL